MPVPLYARSQNAAVQAGVALRSSEGVTLPFPVQTGSAGSWKHQPFKGVSTGDGLSVVREQCHEAVGSARDGPCGRGWSM